MDAYNAGDVAEQVNVSNEFDRQVAPIMVTIESYPNLGSITLASNMMYEISEAENMIAVAKLRYNADVRDFNAHIKKFPASWVAGMGNFEKREYYQPDVEP
jgi:LemA protein